MRWMEIYQAIHKCNHNEGAYEPSAHIHTFSWFVSLISMQLLVVLSCGRSARMEGRISVLREAFFFFFFFLLLSSAYPDIWSLIPRNQQIPMVHTVTTYISAYALHLNPGAWRGVSIRSGSTDQRDRPLPGAPPSTW